MGNASKFEDDNPESGHCIATGQFKRPDATPQPSDKTADGLREYFARQHDPHAQVWAGSAFMTGADCAVLEAEADRLVEKLRSHGGTASRSRPFYLYLSWGCFLEYEGASRDTLMRVKLVQGVEIEWRSRLM